MVKFVRCDAGWLTYGDNSLYFNYEQLNKEAYFRTYGEMPNPDEVDEITKLLQENKINPKPLLETMCQALSEGIENELKKRKE